MRPLHVALLVLAVVTGTASAADGRFDWFPDAVHANCTTGDCSYPLAWSAANQSAPEGLGGGPGADGLLTVAIRDYYPLQPEIYFVPGAWCDTPGNSVPVADIEASLAAPLVSRRLNRRRSARRLAASSPPSRTLLQQGAGTTAVDTVEVSTPCQLLQVSARVGAAGTWQSLAALDGSPVYRLALGTGLPDGVTCIDVRATYDTGASTFAISPAYADLVNGTLPATTAFTHNLCLFEFNRQAAATIKYDMCTSDQFTVNVSAVSPLPVNITLNGAPVAGDANLVRPLIKVWGGKIKELDGTPSSELYDESAAHNQATWISKYLPLPSSYAGEPLSFPLSEQLQEGYYNVSSTVSLLTAYPSLVDLVGVNQITQDDESGVSSGVTGLWEAATLQVDDHVQIGVQKASTPTTLSAIACTSHPVSRAVGAGDSVVLTWQFIGIGSATCMHDGEVVSNAPAGTCVSPLTITARAFSAALPTHKLVVTFTDVCGRVRTAEFDYNAKGVEAVTPTEVIGADGTVQIITKANATGTVSTGAGGMPSPTGRGLVATAVGAAVLLLLLLA